MFLSISPSRVGPWGLGSVNLIFASSTKTNILPDTWAVLSEYMGRWSESKSICQPILSSTLSIFELAKEGQVWLPCRMSISRRHLDKCKAGLRWGPEVSIDLSVVQMQLEQRTKQKSIHVRQNGAFAQSRHEKGVASSILHHWVMSAFEFTNWCQVHF